MNLYPLNGYLRVKAVFEIVLGCIFVFGYIWYVLPGWVSWMHVTIPCLFLGLLLYSKQSRKESFKDLGIRFDNWLHSFKMLLIYLIPFHVLLIIVWSVIFSIHLDFYKHLKFWRYLFNYLFWAFIQQYIFLAFFYNRLKDIFYPIYFLAFIVSAILFSFCHIPNYPLMIITFVSGLISSWIYSKHKNIIVISLLHGIFAAIYLMALSMYFAFGPYADMGRWSRTAPVHSTIELVNKIRPRKKNMPITIDVSAGDITVVGWVAGKDGVIEKVYIRLDKKDYLCKYGFKREDVASHYNNPNYTYSGYFVNIPIFDLKPGYYLMKLKILLKKKRFAHYPTKRVWVKITQ